MDQDAFLAGGAPKAFFTEDSGVGDSVTGVISADPQVTQQTDMNTREPLTWPDGRPKMQLLLDIQTEIRDGEDDTGVRRIYIKGKSLTEQCREALKAAGKKRFDVGGTVTVTFTRHEKLKSSDRFKSKFWSVSYEPPSHEAMLAAQGSGEDPLS